MKLKLLILVVMLPALTQAMDAPVAQPAALEILPNEIKQEIFMALAKGNTLPQAINNILALGRAESSLVAFLRDSWINKYLITELIKKFPQETSNNYVVAGLKLGTPGALAWLKEFAQKNPEIAKEMISEALSFAIGQPQPDTQLLVRLVDAGYATEQQIKEVLRDRIMKELATPTRQFFIPAVDSYLSLFGPKIDEIVNEHGQTFLYRLANNEDYTAADLVLMRELIARGASPNVKDKRGRLILINPIIWGTVAIVKLLLESGADANIQDENGYSALQIAQNGIEGASVSWREKYQQIIDLLKQHGAQPTNNK